MKRVLSIVPILCLIAAPAWASLIADGGFETPVEPASSYNYNVTGGAWTFDSTAGIIYPPSAFNGPDPAAEGLQYAFLQTNHNDGHYHGTNDGWIYQTVMFPYTGQYTLALVNASREDPVNASYNVMLDGSPVLSLQASSKGWTANGGTFTATVGSHTFGFLSTGPSDSTTFLDQVSLTPEPATLALLAAGAAALAARRRRG
jgi:hypothetical protein